MRITVYSVLLLCFVSCAVLFQNASASLAKLNFTLNNCTNDSSPPVVQLAVRSRSALNPAQPFSEWSLLHYYSHDYKGICDCTEDSFTVDSNTQYQFRIELSRASPCYCINTTDLAEELMGLLQLASTITWHHLGSNNAIAVSSTSPLCPSDNDTSIYITDILQRPIDPPHNHDCNNDTFCPHNTTDLAVAYKDTFASSCTTEHCFPFKPLNRTLMQASIDFSLILSFENPPLCAELNDINEGILLKATDHLNFTNNLNFYYSSKVNNVNNETIVPEVFPSPNDQEEIILNYNSTENISVSATFNNDSGLLNFSKNASEILNRISSITWEQYTVNLSRGPDCDVWSLDNVAVTVQYEDCTREVFKENFEGNVNDIDWDLVFTSVSDTPSNCTNSSGSCLYFTGRDTEDYVTVRNATTPPLDLRLVRAVKPPHNPQIANPCYGNQTQIVISFDIATSDFRYPTPCTDGDPNGILLSMNETTNLAYFVPLANTQWDNFNAANITLNVSNTSVPIWSPQLSEVSSTCVSNSTIAKREMLDIVWKQDSYVTGQDYWYLRIRGVKIGYNFITAMNDSASYNVTLVNCVTRQNYTKCNGTGTSRSVTLSLNLDEILPPEPTTQSSSTPTPSPTPSPQPASIEEIKNLTKENPTAGLLKYLEQQQESYSIAERLELLQIAYNEQLREDINETFVKTFMEVFQTGSTPRHTPDQANITTAINLLRLLDDVALSFADNSGFDDLSNNRTITLQDLTLVVTKVQSNAGRVVGLSIQGSNITLPGVLFNKTTEPVLVASYHFKNLAWLIPQPSDNTSYAHPVISSVIRCTECSNQNLSENVTILFNSDPADNFQCVFADVQRGIGEKSMFWTRENTGCTAERISNGSVQCSCNHLTHFAILLSPGVEISQVHRTILTIAGYVLVPISLVFLLATILAYVMLKALWSMRNYIHCMLCANLIAAQLVFVVGVERTENEAVCSAIAVLLHYLFLVVFMWMLMEGVVLYVALVKVFVKHRKRYIAGFTITSYGLPLLYMAVVAPIGFLVDTDETGNHYGVYYNGTLSACWLRYDTHFIYAFIAPVTLITLINIGFLVMTIVIMCRHFKKQDKKNNVASTRHWVKVIILLTVVMGITWIGNVLFFREELLFVAYIITIFIACQGVIIFILFVPLSKQVREAYSKWWKTKQSQSEFLSKMFPTKRSTLAVSGSGAQKMKEQRPQVYVMKTTDISSSTGAFVNPSSPSTFTNNSQDSQTDEKPSNITQLHLSDSPDQIASPDHSRLSPNGSQNGLNGSSQHLLISDSSTVL